MLELNFGKVLFYVFSRFFLSGILFGTFHTLCCEQKWFQLTFCKFGLIKIYVIAFLNRRFSTCGARDWKVLRLKNDSVFWGLDIVLLVKSSTVLRGTPSRKVGNHCHNPCFNFQVSQEVYQSLRKCVRHTKVLNFILCLN